MQIYEKCSRMRAEMTGSDVVVLYSSITMSRLAYTKDFMRMKEHAELYQVVGSIVISNLMYKCPFRKLQCGLVQSAFCCCSVDRDGPGGISLAAVQ